MITFHLTTTVTSINFIQKNHQLMQCENSVAAKEIIFKKMIKSHTSQIHCYNRHLTHPEAYLYSMGTNKGTCISCDEKQDDHVMLWAKTGN